MTAIDLGPFPLPVVVERLRAFAGDYRGGGRPCVYVVYGNILVREDRVLNNPSLLMKVLSHHRRMIKVDLPFTANVIFAATNLRIIGLGGDEHLTAKVRLRGKKGQLFREMTARRVLTQVLADQSRVSIPRARAYDGRDGLWVVEEFVDARHSNSGDAAAFLSAPAASFYGATIRGRAVARMRGGYNDLAGELSRMVPSAGKVAENASWLVALCHGDLTRKNLLRAPDGRFWLVDLELARVMPIAVELGHLCADEPSVTRQALALLARLDPAGETIPPRLQLALGLVAELREQRRCQAVYVIDKVKMFGVSRSEAETKVRAEADGILDLIRAVASPS